ncbi:methyl-accepting chemotaxis protein [Lacibacterium aquatile]|uniref:Methyl-accepting chemotaxis protein n=1 Tax=Lacibacterium aquatile TaxID=1168082 RepID=A0ABW5DTG3_9PROT
MGRISLRNQVRLAAAFLSLIVVAVSASSILQYARSYAAIERGVVLAEAVEKISAVVHEMQKERGLSALFLGSQGKNNGAELISQRKLTDGRIAEWASHLAKIPAGDDFAPFSTLATKGQECLSALPNFRTQVDRLAVAAPQSAATYTGCIANQLAPADMLPALLLDSDTSHLVVAYLSLVKGKERAGQERALGSGIMTAGKAEPEVLKRYLELAAEQNAFFITFKDTAPTDIRQAFLEGPEADIAKKVQAYRNEVYKRSPANDFTGMVGPEWFATSTVRINALKDVEDRFAKIILSTANEAKARLGTSLYTAIGICIAALIAATLASLLLTRQVQRYLGGLARTTREIVQGNTSTEIAFQDRSDEVGEIAQALEGFRANLIETRRLTEDTQAAQSARESRILARDHLVTSFVEQMSHLVASFQQNGNQIDGRANDLSHLVATLGGISERASQNCSEVADYVNSVASTAEELSSAIFEISSQADRAKSVCEGAESETQQMVSTVGNLNQSTNRIRDILGLINTLASQTNLLALNATIEAARAGDAGKGFAVVASEVKALAHQTEQATRDIHEQVEGITANVDQTVKAIDGMVDFVNRLSAITTAIAASIDQQKAATGEIARSVQQAADGTRNVEAEVAGVSNSAQAGAQVAEDLITSISVLLDRSGVLEQDVRVFSGEVKALG